MASSHSDSNNGRIPESMILLGLVIVCLVVLYIVFEYQVSLAILWLSNLNAELLSFIGNLPRLGDNILYVLQPGLSKTDLSELSSWIKYRDPNELYRPQQLTLLGFIGATIRPILMPFIVFQVYRHIKFQRVRSFKKTYTIQTLALESRKFLPHLIPPLSVNLLKIPVNEGKLSKAKPPLRYCIENQLIRVYGINLRDEIDTSVRLMPTFSKVKSLLPNHLYVKQKIDDPEGQRMLFKRCVFVDDSQLTKHFTLRLGNRLTSVYEMSLPRRLLLAMCLLMAKGATKNGVNEAYALNRAINRSFKLKNTLFRTDPLDAKISDCNCDQIIKDNIDNPLFVEALKKHAYELTFLNAAIEIARGYGKFFTSHNYWIKFFDRDLWFMFDQSGSATAWTETSAVRGHYLWEKKCNFAILEPCVDTTIVGLKKFMTHTENWIYQEGYTLE